MIPDLFASSQPPGVRRPKFSISFGAGGDDGLGGLMGAVASVLGQGGADDPWQRALVSVVVETGLAPEVDIAEITLAGGPNAPQFAIDDDGTIELGYEDEGTTSVYSGRIESVVRTGNGLVRIIVANATSDLAGLRVQQSYEDQSAGDIVGELAGKAGVTTGNIAAGSSLAFLVLDDGSSAWQHIARLARVSGHQARVTADGELEFAPVASGSPVQTFTWGVDLLSLERREAGASFDNVTVFGEGAAGSDGKSAWNWLVKEAAPVTGTAGQGSHTRAFVDPALRSADAVRGAAQAVADAAQRAAITGSAIVPGASRVTPGALITIAGSPDGELDGDYYVTRVRHTYAKRTGYRTRITFTGSAGSGGGGGLLGGLL